MTYIEKIVVECERQQDRTGSDSIRVVRNNKEVIGTLTIRSGQLITLKPKQSTTNSGNDGGFVIEAGDNIKIFEADLLGKDDLLVDYTIKPEDISRGSVLLSDTLDEADYTFIIAFRTGIMETNESTQL